MSHSNKTTLTTFVDNTDVIETDVDLSHASYMLQTHLNEL